MWAKEISLLTKLKKLRNLIITFILLALIPYSSFASTNFSLKSKISKPEPKVYSAKQLKEIALAESYLNSINNLSASFTQIDENGGIQKGKFYLSRPGKMRWEYTNPTKILIIVNNKDVVYFDKKRDHISYFTARNDFINLLTKPIINFKDEKIFVKSLKEQDKKVTLILGKEESAEVFTIVFNQNPFEIKTLQTIDNSENHIYITFQDIQQPSSLDPSLFEFTEHKYLRK
jgi:outer membrane lipoprotein-sorting protein